MQGFWLEDFVFAEKAIKSRSLFAGYSFQILVQLTILGEHLSNSIHDGKQLSFIIQTTIFIINIFHFLLYVAKGLSSPNIRESRTIRIEFVNLARQT